MAAGAASRRQGAIAPNRQQRLMARRVDDGVIMVMEDLAIGHDAIKRQRLTGAVEGDGAVACVGDRADAHVEIAGAIHRAK